MTLFDAADKEAGPRLKAGVTMAASGRQPSKPDSVRQALSYSPNL
ncbi:hypothetical protein [Sphingobium yanoikuyae]|nr:hypothetical protein [Sphingobium yanoikuyae]